MNVFVVDASVAAKWFLEEDFSAEAERLLQPEFYLHVPEFLYLELDHVLCKRIRRGELTAEEAEEVRAMLSYFPLHRHPTSLLQDAAFALASSIGRGIYDCLYLILARFLGTKMLTADRRFLEALAHEPLARHLCWIGDLERALSENPSTDPG